MTGEGVSRSSAHRAPSAAHAPFILVVLVTLLLRVLHMLSALGSPLTYEPGPDEDYYLRYGHAIADSLTLTPEFAFMDPAYGYVLGAVFKLFGTSNLIIFLLQSLIDTVTAACIYLIGRELDRERAGLIGAAIYAVAATAIFFSATFLKATWVANFMAVWVLGCLIALRTRAWYPWLLLGLWCGYGVALRGTLLLMTFAAVLIVPWLKRPRAELKRAAPLFVVGLALPLIALSLRNYHFDGSVSPLPQNGGVVFHSLYNSDNPKAAHRFPSFVQYPNPSEIRRAYTAEAERRSGRSLAPHEVDRYWAHEAFAYIASHPGDFAMNLARKLGTSFAYTEFVNNRSIYQEREFSWVLRMLPLPFAFLFALGLPGIVLAVRSDRRAWLLMAPLASTAALLAVFFVEDRFRFHAYPILALGAGLLIDDLIRWVQARDTKKVAIAATASVVLGAASIAIAQQVPPPPSNATRVVWGYLKMQRGDARALAKAAAERLGREQPNNAEVQEQLGYLAAADGRFIEAVAFYHRAVELNPDAFATHYNLATLLFKLGEREQGAREAALAIKLAPEAKRQSIVDELARIGAQ